MLNVMSVQAEDYLERIKANWSATTQAAVAQGIHISGKVPVGYRRDEDRRLTPDPDTADAVRAAFEMRAGGASHREIVDHLRGEVGRGFAKSAITAMLRNRVYLGEARGPGGARNASAHPPLVSEELFAAVQGKRGVAPTRNGAISSQARLGGLITCASCGHKLRVMGSTNPNTGERKASYVCATKYASGDCEAPAIARVELVDGYVAEQLSESWEEVTSGAESARQRFIRAQEDVAAAEEALDAWVDDPAIELELGRERFRRGLLARQTALEDARRRTWEMQEIQLPRDKPVVWIDEQPFVYELWGEDAEADRRHLRRHVASVTLAKADPARRRWQPIEERVAIRWVGDA